MLQWGETLGYLSVFLSISYGQSTYNYFYTRQTNLCYGENLYNSFNDWKFSPSILLNLPVETNRANYVRQVDSVIFSAIAPTPLKTKLRLAAISDGVLSSLLNLHPCVSDSEQFLQFVSGNSLLADSTTLCHRYGGHQFGVWADQLGDGRAHLLGEYVDDQGLRWELQLKGSGLTPYSRQGDGRAVIRSSVREFLASEAMYYLGLPTSRAASLVVSDDPVIRDQFYNGHIQQERAAVVLRLAKSWFRIGSLEVLEEHKEIKLLKKLTDHVIKHHFPSINITNPDRYLELFDTIVKQTASMIAQWMSVGFAHGVCNTDNFSLLSITIDYGPFRFMDEYDPQMVPNTSDDESRYRYENQPDVGYFNLNKLRIALEPLLSADQRKQMKLALNGYAHYYKTEFMRIFKQKLGLYGTNEQDEYIVALFLKLMKNSKGDFTMTFRELGDLTLQMISEQKVDPKLWALTHLAKDKSFSTFLKLYYNRLSTQTVSDSTRKYQIHRVNPRYVLRNWIAQEVIAQVENNNFILLKTTLAILENPYMEQESAELLGYADPPPDWASKIKVSCSS